MWLEGGGGGNYHESYELSAYFYGHHTKLTNAELPLFFVTGDEHYWDSISKNDFHKVFPNAKDPSTFKGLDFWKELSKHFNVFHIKKPYGESRDDAISKQWENAVGKTHVMRMHTPKACIDVILGVIAITSGSRNL